MRIGIGVVKGRVVHGGKGVAAQWPTRLTSCGKGFVCRRGLCVTVPYTVVRLMVRHAEGSLLLHLHKRRLVRLLLVKPVQCARHGGVGGRRSR